MPLPPVRTIAAAEGRFTIGDGRLALIAGPCLVEDFDTTMALAEQIGEIAAQADMAMAFKASYDKANRTSVDSARGPGWRRARPVCR